MLFLYESGTFMSLFHFHVVTNIIMSPAYPFHQERMKTLVEDYAEVRVS